MSDSNITNPCDISISIDTDNTGVSSSYQVCDSDVISLVEGNWGQKDLTD